MLGSENTFSDRSLTFEDHDQRACQIPSWVRWCAIFSWNLNNFWRNQNYLRINSEENCELDLLSH